MVDIPIPYNPPEVRDEPGFPVTHPQFVDASFADLGSYYQEPPLPPLVEADLALKNPELLYVDGGQAMDRDFVLTGSDVDRLLKPVKPSLWQRIKKIVLDWLKEPLAL